MLRRGGGAVVMAACLAQHSLFWRRPVQNSPNNTPPAPQPVQNSPSNTPPAPQPVQNSPSNTPPAPQPVQNSPSTHKIGKIRPFWTCRANFLSLLELAQPAGRTFSRIRRHSTQYTHTPSPNRYKTHPATPAQGRNRHITSPASRLTTAPPVTTTAKTNQYPTLKAPLLRPLLQIEGLSR